MIEQTPEKDIKQKQNNHNDEEIEIDLIGILRKIIGIRKTIYKAAGIGLVVGIIVAISIPKQYTVGVTLSPESSMRVNDEADKKQATADDPRKTKFGNFLRRSNIDELPQFINVFKGEMSIVGPRPHMLAHTETYARLIDKYMVRHFIKPGVTGWAQTHGFRGETKELSQMEGRVQSDIWYMEHWTLLLDLYIIYKTIANVIVGEKNAY